MDYYVAYCTYTHSPPYDVDVVASVGGSIHSVKVVPFVLSFGSIEYEPVFVVSS